MINKEQHATNIQKTVSGYFLIQRVKTGASQKYIEQTTTLHQILIVAMECKQTVDDRNVNRAIQLVDTFKGYYIDSHGMEHIIKLSE